MRRIVVFIATFRRFSYTCKYLLTMNPHEAILNPDSNR